VIKDKGITTKNKANKQEYSLSIKKKRINNKKKLKKKKRKKEKRGASISFGFS